MAAPGTWLFPNNAKDRLAKGKWDIDAATLAARLFQSTTSLGAASVGFAAVTNEIANGNGYATGGLGVDLAFVGALNGAVWEVTVKLAVSPIWTASGAGLAARWVGVGEVGGDTLCYMELDSAHVDATASAGNQITIDHDGDPLPLYVFK